MIARVHIVLHWSARITALLLVGLVLLFMFGQGPPNPFRHQPIVQGLFFAMLLMLAGFVAGWRWELAGGLLAVGGYALFNAIQLGAYGKPAGGAWPLFIVPGALYLASYAVGLFAR
jgi:hypothetical protein